MDSTPQDPSMLAKVQNYRKIVLIYEGFNREIDELLTANAGGTEHMTANDLARYHEMARKRDELFNEMRIIEHQLLNKDSLLTDEDNS